MTRRVYHIMYVTPCLDSRLVIFVHICAMPSYQNMVLNVLWCWCSWSNTNTSISRLWWPQLGTAWHSEAGAVLRRPDTFCILYNYILHACCVNDISKSGMMSSCDTSIEKWCCSLNSCTTKWCRLSIYNVNGCISCPSSGAIITDLDSTILSWPPYQILTFAPWSRKIPCAFNANPFLFVS